MINITVLDMELDAMSDECNHDLAEQETACADGFCPICATAKIVQLERELAAAIASFSEERERAQREGSRVIELQVKLAEAVAKERERCAKVCEERSDKYGEGDGYSPSKESGCFECAAAIRKGE
jgi:hypothetical protein